MNDVQPDMKSAEATQKQCQPNLGHSFLVLFQANRSAIRKAIVDIDRENVLSSALKALVEHIDTNKIATERAEEVYEPLLDKILKKSGESEKQISFLLLDWMILWWPHRELVARALSKELTLSVEKRRKLAVLLAIEHALHTQDFCPTKSTKRCRNDLITNSSTQQQLAANNVGGEQFPNGQFLLDWINPLLHIIQNDTPVNSEGNRYMTRLTSLALDVAIHASKIFADEYLIKIRDLEEERKKNLVMIVDPDETQKLLQSVHGRCFLKSMQAMHEIFTEYQTWNIKRNEAASASLLDTLDILSSLNKCWKSGAVVSSCHAFTSYAQTWSIISSILIQRSNSLIPSSLMDQVNRYVQMEIHPYQKLVAICTTFGLCSPSITLDQLFSALREPLESVLHAYFTCLEPNIDQVFGHNSALALQKALAPNMTDVGLKSMKSWLVTSLDTPHKITMKFAHLLAHLITFFPALLVRELIVRLQSSSDQSFSMMNEVRVYNRLWNSTQVVKALAEMNFFTTLSEDEDQKFQLEDAMIDLLLIDDVKIKMTASSFVVSIVNPRKVIGILVRKLTSDDSQIRSNAELILIDYMLSQSKGGYVGDGFSWFIEYLRRGLPKNIPVPNSGCKINSPAQLVLKFKQATGISADHGDIPLDDLLRVIKKLGEMIPCAIWKSFIDRMVIKTYGSPSDQLLIRVWNNLAPSIAASTDAIVSLSTAILEIMERQGVLGEDLLEVALEVTDEAIDDLRFARLSPLLVLKTIPAHGFAREYRKLNKPSGVDNDAKPIPEKMRLALAERIDNPLEFSIVRTLSTAITHSMFPDSSLEAIYTGMSKVIGLKPLQVDQLDLAASRSWLFAMYDWIVNWNIQSDTSEQISKACQWIYRIITNYFYPIVRITSEQNVFMSELYKLQLGIVDVLSKTILCTAPYNSGCFSKGLERISKDCDTSSVNAPIDELRGDEVITQAENSISPIPSSPQDLLLAILRDILSVLTDVIIKGSRSNLPSALCLINVLFMTMQSLASGSTIGSQATVNHLSPAPSSDCVPCRLMDLVSPTLGECAMSFLRDNTLLVSKKEYLPLIQGCIQVLYTAASAISTVGGCTVSRETSQWAMDVAVLGIESIEETIAVTSLKLLAAISAAHVVTAEVLTDSNEAAIRRGLTRLAQSSSAATTTETMAFINKVWEIIE